MSGMVRELLEWLEWLKQRVVEMVREWLEWLESFGNSTTSQCDAS